MSACFTAVSCASKINALRPPASYQKWRSLKGFGDKSFPISGLNGGMKEIL
jgi:hypothetical protein